MDLIDRQALLRQIDIDSDGEPGYYGDTWKFIDTIKRMPSAQPKRGRWVLVCDNNGMHFICNKCGAWRYHQKQKFCGECGSDMRGEQDG